MLKGRDGFRVQSEIPCNTFKILLHASIAGMTGIAGLEGDLVVEDRLEIFPVSSVHP